MRAERRFTAMGTTGLVAIIGESWLVERALARVQELEARWSRFRDESELNALCARAGESVGVSPDTLRLVQTACAAAGITKGAFDPTVRDAMVANGYDRTFTEVVAGRVRSSPPRPAPGTAGIVVDAAARTVTLPAGVGLDPGGIGKGLAADMIADETMSLGASGVLVDLGGDISCRGDGPHDGRWIVDVEHPWRSDALLHLALRDVAIATSSCLRRRWGHGAALHHIVNPTTGRPSNSPVVTATVIAAEAWRAEALATAIIVTGSLEVIGDASAIALDRDGAVHATSDLLELVA